ncbi:hypothetical protein BU24DRAFT_426115 [Aaosphaeria arxii CBS 175.79]|uniref:Ig-like domain-containing protein n=1 Tax=Aaosphaeria arxii CBS 175.79 TaxID=1450172 RepID=A0A6A5XGP9_9PLEO|nr:uncharacterized protein BU24DRAFT_426115 [Aaosphaeria arxii CBS 175.79]KAF2012262.1 hypothetical protein BU24DRAFT_426115 [Aaosphaeria arxii CBS 175.79]
MFNHSLNMFLESLPLFPLLWFQGGEPQIVFPTIDPSLVVNNSVATCAAYSITRSTSPATLSNTYHSQKQKRDKPLLTLIEGVRVPSTSPVYGPISVSANQTQTEPLLIVETRPMPGNLPESTDPPTDLQPYAPVISTSMTAEDDSFDCRPVGDRYTCTPATT